MKLTGWVGPGKGYDSGTREWTDEVEKVLGYTPFRGTLNISIRPKLVEEEVLAQYQTTVPFRDFVCLEGEINGVRAHFCYSRHRANKDISTFYVISPHKLREHLNLNDKDKVQVEIHEKPGADSAA